MTFTYFKLSTAQKNVCLSMTSVLEEYYLEGKH